MKRRNIGNIIGKQLPNSLLTPLGYAGTDSRRYSLVKCRCQCGRVTKPRLCDVLSGHTTSCGCVKHQRYVEHVEKDVSRLSPDSIKECFLSVVDSKAPKPNLSEDVILAAYYRRTESLKSLPDHVALDVRLRVLAHDKYAAIARDNGLHPAEVAWLYKHVIRPEVERQRGTIDTLNHLKGFALDAISYAKGELKEQRRTWFLAKELRTPGSKPGPKDDLGFAWYWMMNCAPLVKLNSDEDGLLAWFRLTAASTFQKRRDNRIEMGRRQSEKRWNEIEAAA